MRIPWFLLLLAFLFSSCTTLSNRRDLYHYSKGSGPWTRKLVQMERRLTLNEWRDQRRAYKEARRERRTERTQSGGGTEGAYSK